ncbi:hypothetical protein [Nocardia salmonicida]|uniref:hypothetical protein n=1 Tax=Nocardia salmonicida TaxID=53431 RepID=UPI0007A3B685|nr:hypothetical protein [Nocardia salmonicida]MBC7299441.1 hypothetical protein [Nocardia sp.]
MNPAEVFDADAQHTIAWVNSHADQLRQLPNLPVPIRFAHAMNAFTAIGVGASLLYRTTEDEAEERQHWHVVEIGDDAPDHLDNGVGPTVARRYCYAEDQTLPPGLSMPDGLTPAARTQLRRAARDTASALKDLLHAISADGSVPPGLRQIATDTVHAADLVSALYDDDPRKARLVCETLPAAQEARHDQLEQYFDALTFGGVYEPTEERIMALAKESGFPR